MNLILAKPVTCHERKAGNRCCCCQMRTQKQKDCSHLFLLLHTFGTTVGRKGALATASGCLSVPLLFASHTTLSCPWHGVRFREKERGSVQSYLRTSKTIYDTPIFTNGAHTPTLQSSAHPHHATAQDPPITTQLSRIVRRGAPYAQVGRVALDLLSLSRFSYHTRRVFDLNLARLLL